MAPDTRIAFADVPVADFSERYTFIENNQVFHAADGDNRSLAVEQTGLGVTLRDRAGNDGEEVAVRVMFSDLLASWLRGRGDEAAARGVEEAADARP